MAFENLDFSGWKSGNKALAASKIDSTNAYAKAQALKDAGISAGIGTVIGAIFGAPEVGYSIGKMVSSNPEAEQYMKGGEETVGKISDAFESWSSDRSATKKKGVPFGEGTKNEGDYMQLASSMNMIDDNGNIKPTFLNYLQSIGKMSF